MAIFHGDLFEDLPDMSRYVTKISNLHKDSHRVGPVGPSKNQRAFQIRTMQIASVVCFRFLFQLSDPRTRLKSSLWLLGTQTIFGSCHERFPGNSQTAMPSAPLLTIGHHHCAIGVNCIGQHQGNPECQSA